MDTCWLHNVRLEQGYVEEDGLLRTVTQAVNIRIEDGKFAEIVPCAPQEGAIDGQGRLLLPALKENHIHIDKTYYGGKWISCAKGKDLLGRLEEEKVLLPELLKTMPERTRKIIEMLQRNGHAHIRGYCNVDPIIGIQNYLCAKQILEEYKGRLTYELAAFPQHGLLRSDTVPYMRQAMEQGADVVGLTDPGLLDRDVLRSLRAAFDIAKEFDRPLDMHLHEQGTLGLYTMQRLCDMVEEYGWQGRVNISSAVALSSIDSMSLQAIVQRLAQLKISVSTSVSFGAPIPVPYLDQSGVRVVFGHDSLLDHFGCFGTGDTIEKLSNSALCFKISDHVGLAQMLKYATDGVTPLDSKGNYCWPKPGDRANFILTDAQCSSELVARRNPICALYVEGRKIFHDQ